MIRFSPALMFAHLPVYCRVFDDAKKVYKQSNQKLDATNKQLQKVIKQRSEAFKTAESSHGTALNTLLDLRNSERKRKEQLGKLKRELEDLVELTREPVEEADSSDLTAQLVRHRKFLQSA